MYITDDSPNVKLIESSLCAFTLLSACGLSVWHWEIINWPYGGRVCLMQHLLFVISFVFQHPTDIKLIFFSLLSVIPISVSEETKTVCTEMSVFFFFSFVTFSVEIRGGSKSNPAAVTEASFGCEWSHRTSWRLSHCFSNNVHVVLLPSYPFCHHCNAYKHL